MKLVGEGDLAELVAADEPPLEDCGEKPLINGIAEGKAWYGLCFDCELRHSHVRGCVLLTVYKALDSLTRGAWPTTSAAESGFLSGDCSVE